MADLNVLGALSGISRGSIKGLSMLRENERAQEEKDRQERNRRIQYYRTYIPDMDAKQAERFLAQDDVLGDDDKRALLGVAGLRVKQQDQVDLSSVEGQLQQLRGGELSPEEAYNMFEGNLLQKNLPKAQSEQWLARARRMLDIQQEDNIDGYGGIDKFIDDWRQTKTVSGRRALAKYIKGEGKEKWLTAVSEEIPKPAPRSTGRTDEEILDDQVKEADRRISDINFELKQVESAFANLEEGTPTFDAAIKRRNELKRHREFFVDQRTGLRETGAKPVKNLKEYLTPPKPKAKPRAGVRESTKDLPRKVGEIILRKKAYQWLKKNAPKDTWSKDILTDEQIIENIKAVIDQGLVK
jgi:hypothetical protein